MKKIITLCLLAFIGTTTLNAQIAGCFKTISAGQYHTIAIKTDGSLWAWGHNSNGQLGDGTNTVFMGANNDKNSPVQIGSATNWESISLGQYYSIGIKTDGTLWAWGNNSYGQLGDGSNADRFSPVQIGTATNWVKISTGLSFTTAIKADGTLWAWGLNNFGQLGDGTTTFRNSPVQIGSATNWASISSGYYHTIATKTDGSLWTWGYNVVGQLGDGTTTQRDSPVQVGSETNWANISGGGAHSIAIKADGTLWAWGKNTYGQLGDGTTIQRNSPVQIGTHCASIGAGYYHSIAIKINGSLWAWGHNAEGELGDGTTTDKHSPLQIGSATNWVSIGVGGYHTLAKNTVGSLWTWGYNIFGQLGDGTTTQRNSLVQISSCCIPTTSRFTINVCNSYTWAAKSNKVYTASNNTDTIHLTNAGGCDSLVTLNLSIKTPSSSTTNVSICPSALPYSWNGSRTAAGTYTFSTTNSQGCDSIATLYLAVVSGLPAITGSNAVCAGATTTLNNAISGGVWSTQATSQATINAVTGLVSAKNAGTITIQYSKTGCSSITKTLVVNAIPVVPTIAYAPGTPNPQTGAPTGGFCVGKVFTVVGTPNSPAGVWSATGFASITTGGVVSVVGTGAGSVKYTYTNAAGCSNSRTMSGTGYTCAARGVSASGEGLVVSGDFTMYPNPAKGLINLNIETLVGKGSIFVTDLYGKTVKTQALSMGTNTVDIANLSKGMYFVSTITNEGKTTKKLIME